MALLFMDSFDHYNTAAMIDKWGIIVPTSGIPGGQLQAIAAVGRRGSNGFQLIGAPNTGQSGNVARSLFPADNKIVVGCAVKWTGVNSNFLRAISESPGLISVRMIGGTQLWLSLNTTTGFIDVMRGTTVIGTSAFGLAVAAVVYVELMATIALGTAGDFQLRINGTPVAADTGINTANVGVEGYDQLRLGGFVSSTGGGGPVSEFDYDDLYVCDGSGPAPWNTFLGDCRVDAGRPTANGALHQWVPLSSTNVDMVDDPSPDGDTTYVSSNVPGDTDTYVVPDAAIAGASILGVQVNVDVRKEDAGSCPISAVARVGGTNYPVPVSNPGTTYQIKQAIFQTNPATSAAWLDTEFNGAEFGFSRA